MFKSILKSLTIKNGFYAKLPLTKKSYFKIYERPGMWCDQDEIDLMVKDLRQIASEGQNGKPIPEYGVLSGGKKDLENRIISISYDSKTHEPIGFSAQIYLDLKEHSYTNKILHLGLIYISPKAQGKNISYLLAMLPNMLLLIKSGFKNTWVSNVSQIPAVVGLVDKNYSHVYPSVDEAATQTFLHKKLGELIMKDHRAAFGVGEDADYDYENQVIRNAYTGGSDNMKKKFSETTKHRDTKINDLCENSLDYERGDDFLQLGVLSFKSALDLLKNKKSRQSLPQVFISLVFISFLSLLIPPLRWVLLQSNDLSKDHSAKKGMTYE